MTIDARNLVVALISIVRSTARLDESLVAKALTLDMSRAAVTGAESAIAVTGAKLDKSGQEIDFLIGWPPPRVTLVVSGDEACADDLMDGQIEGRRPRIDRATRGDGYAVLYDLTDVVGGITVSTKDRRIETIFCERRRSTR